MWYLTGVRDRLLAGVLALAYLTLGTSPAHFWLDSGEIAAAAAELGVMHPTGVPGLIPVFHLATAIPVGPLGFRLAVMSSLFGAWALVLLLSILRRRDVHPWIAWGALLWVLVGLTFLRNARVVEIYTFGAWLAMVVLWGLDPRAPRARRTGYRLLGTMAAVWAALGFGDLRLALVVPLVVYWVRALRRREAWARWAPLCVVLSTAVVATLPLASARAPITDWGDPDSWGRVWDHLQARSIRDAFGARVLPGDLGPWIHELGRAGGRLAEDLGPFGPAVAIGGLIAWWRCPADRGLVIWVTILAAVEVFYIVAINPMGGVDRQTGLLLAFLAALCVAVPLDIWARSHPRARWAVLPLCAVLLLSPAALASFSDHRVTRSWAPHAWTRGALAQLPPGTLLLTQTDDLSAGVLAARVLEGARPDVISLPAQHLYHRAPDRVAEDGKLREVWAAAGRGRGERGRIEEVLDMWSGPVALESPGSVVFAGIPWERGHGQPPVSWRPSRQARAVPEAVSNDPGGAAILRWDLRLKTVEDRRRLAGALGRQIRHELGSSGVAPRRLERAAEGYARILERVSPDHVSSLVALGAIRDALGRPDEAIALTRRALDLEPDRPRALTNLALYLSRDPALVAEARALAERAADTRPDLPRGWQRLEQICAQQGDKGCVERARARLDRGE